MSEFAGGALIVNGVAEFQARMARAQRFVQRYTINAMRRGGYGIRMDAIERGRQRGVLRTIFSKKTSGLKKLITMSRVRIVDGSPEATFKIKGLAALQEQGGVVAQHIIRPKGGGKLAFIGRGGRLVVVPEVKHPDSRLPRIPSFAPAWNSGRARVIEEVRKAVDQAVKDSDLG